MVRTGKQTTYFQTTEQRSVYDPSRGHTFSRGQVSLQEGIGRCLEEKNSFFREKHRSILYLRSIYGKVQGAQCLVVICLRLPQYLASIWAVVWETAETLWSVWEPHLHKSQYTRTIHHFQHKQEATFRKTLVHPGWGVGGQHSDGQVEATWERTYDTLGEWCALERGQAQVPNLDRSRRTCDKNVVALQVPVDDGGGPSVQEVKALEDLPAPAAEDFDFHHLEPL